MANTDDKVEEKKVEPPAAPVKVELPADAIAKIQKDATDAAREAAQKESQKTREQIVRAVKGDDDSSDVNTRVLEKFANDPYGVLSTVGEQAKREALEEFRAEQKAEREAAAEQKRKEEAKDAEHKAQVNELFEKRPDIKVSKEARELFNRYLITTDPALPEKERFAQAQTEYDAFMKKIDGKSPEDRIKAAGDVSTVSGGAPEPTKQKTTNEARAEYLAHQRAMQAKKRNGLVSTVTLKEV